MGIHLRGLTSAWTSRARALAGMMTLKGPLRNVSSPGSGSTPIGALMHLASRSSFGHLSASASCFRQPSATPLSNLVMRSPHVSRLIALLVFGSPLPIQAQVAQPAGPPLWAAMRAAALDTIREKFRHLYVVPELRPAIVDRLTQAQEAGRYDVDDPRAFAELITEDLQDIAHDKHLRLSFDPPAYAAALAPTQSDAGEEAHRRDRATRNNHGIAEIRILPGNVRYLRIVRFEWVTDETGAIYDAAMRFLKDGDAWIVDLRGNGGGTSSAAQYFSSHFHLPGTATFTSSVGSETPVLSSALDYLPAGRLIGKPLYLLVDGNVGSAAEAVAYDLQQFKIARVLGSRTAGAAYNNKLLPIAPSFILSISYGRPLHVITAANWEGVGVQPDVACDPVVALDMAQSLALAHLMGMSGVPAPRLTEYRWARPAVEARLHPASVTATQMRAWSGHFSSPHYGEISVSIDAGALWLERPGRPRARLTSLDAAGLFAIDGNELLRAQLSGKTLELLWWDAPDPRVFVRR